MLLFIVYSCERSGDNVPESQSRSLTGASRHRRRLTPRRPGWVTEEAWLGSDHNIVTGPQCVSCWPGWWPHISDLYWPLLTLMTLVWPGQVLHPSWARGWSLTRGQCGPDIDHSGSLGSCLSSVSPVCVLLFVVSLTVSLVMSKPRGSHQQWTDHWEIVSGAICDCGESHQQMDIMRISATRKSSMSTWWWDSWRSGAQFKSQQKIVTINMSPPPPMTSFL